MKSYVGMVETHIIPEIGRYPVGKLDHSHVQTMLNRKAESGLSARTVAYIRVILRSALSHALRRGIIARNVAAHARAPRGTQREAQPFTVEEVRRLFSAVAGDRHEAAYIIAGTLGLCRGEVLGLRWEDVDLDAGVVRIHQQIQHVGGTVRLVPVKTKKSIRSLPLTANVREAIGRRRAHQEQERLLAGDRWQESGLVFTSTVGTVVNPANFYKRYQRVLKDVGLEGHTFHDLRHTASTLLVRQGVQTRVAMEILGHANIAVTMNVYAHVVGDSMRDAVAALEDRLEAEK